MTPLNIKTRWYIVVGLLALVAVIVAACGPLSTPTPTPEPISTPTATPKPAQAPLTGDEAIMNEEKVIRGLVVENNLGCRVDALCYLRLLSNDQEILVVYHYGEWPPCLNEEAADQGEQLKEGEQVEVLGKVIGDGRVSTCDSPDYYIRKLR